MLSMLTESEKAIYNATSTYDSYLAWDRRVNAVMMDIEKAMEPAYHST
jgi:hypothetical protein